MRRERQDKVRAAIFDAGHGVHILVSVLCEVCMGSGVL